MHFIHFDFFRRIFTENIEFIHCKVKKCFSLYKYFSLSTSTKSTFFFKYNTILDVKRQVYIKKTTVQTT